MEGKDFYFELSSDENGTAFLITPVKYYDEQGCLSDQSGVADGVVPGGFYELQESIYEFSGTPEIGRELLLKIGMIEIKFGLRPGEESVHPNNSEYDYDMENDLDNLLNDTNQELNAFDYKNITTDKLLRHLNMMLKTDSFEEAAKIRDELKERGVTNF